MPAARTGPRPAPPPPAAAATAPDRAGPPPPDRGTRSTDQAVAAVPQPCANSPNHNRVNAEETEQGSPVNARLGKAGPEPRWSCGQHMSTSIVLKLRAAR